MRLSRRRAYTRDEDAALNILLTGASGLIGGEVARRLVAAGHRVTALVHRTADVRGNDGAAVPLAGTVRGDVAAVRLGWDEATHARVAHAHDLVVHCAASVRFDMTDADYDRVNIGGTANVAALARAGGCDLLHVSTAYVCGRADGLVPEARVRSGVDFANGYERSKAAAEAVVVASGVRWAIARPSIVVGEHATGAIRSFDTIYVVFRLIAQGLVRRLPVAAHATLDLVPIDHVAGGLVNLAARMEAAAGSIVHLTAAAPVPVATFRDAIARRPHFAVPELVPADLFDPAALPQRERRVWLRAAGVYASYFARDPRFVAERLAALSGHRCPPTDGAFLDRLIGHGLDAGFLPRS